MNLKTIQSDIEIAYSCVGKTVDGKSPEALRVFPTDSLINLEHFDANLMGAAEWGKSCDQETVQKSPGIKFAEVKEKSNNYPSFNLHVKWSAYSRWSFRPNSALGSIGTMTIRKTHPTLY